MVIVAEYLLATSCRCGVDQSRTMSVGSFLANVGMWQTVQFTRSVWWSRTGHLVRLGVVAAVAVQRVVRAVGAGQVGAAAAHPVVVARVAVDALQVVAAGGHVHVELGLAVAQLVLEVAPLEVGAAAGTGSGSAGTWSVRAARCAWTPNRAPAGSSRGSAATPSCRRRPGTGRAGSRRRGRSGSRCSRVARGDSSGLRLRAQTGVALGAALGDDLAVAVDRVADPAGQRVGAEIVHRVHLAQPAALGVDDVAASRPATGSAGSGRRSWLPSSWHSRQVAVPS